MRQIAMQLFLGTSLLSLSMSIFGAQKITLDKGDHVAIIGGGIADRFQHDGWLETLIQKKYSNHEIVIRNLAFSGDEVISRLGTETGATREQWLSNIEADVVLAFYGFNESFSGQNGIAKFKDELDVFLKEKLTTKHNGNSPPKLVLYSPIAHEECNDQNISSGATNNRNLEAYTQAMSEVSSKNGVHFVNLFEASKKLYESSNETLTINGVHLNEKGNRLLATIIVESGFIGEVPPEDAELERLRSAVKQKNESWHERYRTVDSYNIFGKRSQLSYASKDGEPKISNAEIMQQEMSVRDVMTANRDQVVWATAQGKRQIVDDTNLPKVKRIKSNLPGSNPDGSHPYLSGQAAIEKMTVPKGCKVNLFASEETFPELVKPVQMSWDTKGRLWIASWKNYPERTPEDKDGDRLLILEDNDGDGVADVCKTFAKGLNCPTGFQFFKDGVLVMRSPDLLFLRDTDGDDKADWQERVLMGLDAADSHHETNSMLLDPGGATYLSDGVFHRSQVETASGVVRNSDGAIYRYEPLTHKFERYIAYNFANPHGRVFDYWGNDIVTDATMNSNYFAPAFSGYLEYPHKHGKMEQFWSRPSRPCPGTAILSSRHFPDEYNGNFLNCNVIGMQGIFRVKVTEAGSGLKGTTLEHLLISSDKNFRPTGCSVAPDGSLYIMDWANAIIGHMQHHLRDPNRDQIHGRIYRMTFDGRPLLKPTKIDGESIATLLDALKEPEDNVRLRAKIELGKRAVLDVIAQTKKWLEHLNVEDSAFEHHVLEALWVHQWHNIVDVDLLKRVLMSPDHRARAAGTRVLCYWRDRIPDALSLLKTLANDKHPRVRLEAVRAASFFRGNDLAEANSIAYDILKNPLDYYLDYTYRETLKQFRLLDKNPYLPADSHLRELITRQASAPPVASDEGKKYGPTRTLSKAQLKTYEQGKSIYFRDAHCVTCHQPNGQGLSSIYPPLTSKEWLGGDDERLVKIVLKGLWGPMEVSGKLYDSSKATPPMTGFEQLLKDEEVAAVLTYVRQSFGNDFDPISVDLVNRVRLSAKNKNTFYLVDDIMKEHPIEGWEKWKTDASKKETQSNVNEIADFKQTLLGGNASNGRKVFFESEKVRCSSCHRIGKVGADIGPDLTTIGAFKDPEYLLTALIAPSREITTSYQTLIFKTIDGRVVMGIVKSEDEKKVKIASADGSVAELDKSTIKTRTVLRESSMPPLGDVLTRDEIRDLIEYLKSLK